jgi:hypothetical protein
MAQQLLSIILTITATYRLTKLINDDYIFNDLRQKVWAKYPRDTKIGYLFTCPWCMSIWAGGALLLTRKFAPEFYNELALLLTASAVTGILNERL